MFNATADSLRLALQLIHLPFSAPAGSTCLCTSAVVSSSLRYLIHLLLSAPTGSSSPLRSSWSIFSFANITAAGLIWPSPNYEQLTQLWTSLLLIQLLSKLLGNRGGSGSRLSIRQSGPRPEGRLLRQPALEDLTRSARTDSPRKVGRSNSGEGRRRRLVAIRSTTGRETPSSACTRRPDEISKDGFSSKSWPEQLRRGAAAAACGWHGGGGGGGLERRERRSRALGSRTSKNPPPTLNTLSSVSVRESRIQYLCDPQWFRDTASRGPTTIVAPESQFRTCPSDHDSIGYPRMSASGESSITMHRLLHASGPHPIPPPNDPKIRALALIPLLGNRGGSGSRLPARQRKNKIRPGNAAVDSSIRFTTGRETPSSACTRRPDEISVDGFSSKIWPKQLRRGAAAAARGGHGGGGGLERMERRSRALGSRTSKNPPPTLNTLSSVSVRESRIQYLCDPQWFRDTASRGPTTIVAPESQFRTCPSDHDSIGYPRMSASSESSTTMHRLLHASGPHPIPPPNDPKKVPLEDLIYTSCTDPIPQPVAARTPRLHQPSTVTHLFYTYVRKATNTEFNIVVLVRINLTHWENASTKADEDSAVDTHSFYRLLIFLPQLSVQRLDASSIEILQQLIASSNECAQQLTSIFQLVFT
ncbi:hypothetical protein F511_36003 [Dorcoceras hygrometricum]|uniref:Uncharacterized protein n=1 Tax=Dorcoceras hygrometricum TaxID=472368 RepID=A0A2Z7DBV1_9LAMI|nr:hypothetical protein F511_36003 [Dorcoceras hygrometricum]